MRRNLISPLRVYLRSRRHADPAADDLHRGRRCLPALVIFLAALALPGIAQEFPQSPPASLFVPVENDHFFVPLSEFVNVEWPIGSIGPIELSVHNDIYDYLVNQGQGNVRIARRETNGVITFLTPTIDQINKKFRIDWAINGDYVVVSNALLNDFILLAEHDDFNDNPATYQEVPGITTHWRADKNDDTNDTFGPRGGQEKGAGHCFEFMDYDPLEGKIPDSEWSSKNTDPDHSFNNDPDKYMYYYATNKYALLSDGTEPVNGEPASCYAPSYERYIGENYSGNGPTALAAIYLSDCSRAQSGYPIAHRSRPPRFQLPGLNDGMPLQDDLPVIQIGHAYIVGDGVLGMEGKNSLATFVLPPHWKSNVVGTPYPTMVCGFYDIHSLTFKSAWGLRFIEAIGKLRNNSENLPRYKSQAVGIFWNGGGSGVSYTMHRSAYDNINLLMEFAADEFKCDTNHVMFAGSSKGGGTALAMAANPYEPTSYTAKYVLAQSPQVRPHDSLETFGNPTYYLAHSHINGDTGYTNSWKAFDDEWVDPNPSYLGEAKNARDLAQYNLFGEDDDAVLDDQHCSNSWRYIHKLVERRTKVVLRIGTHDYSTSITHMVDYVDRLRYGTGRVGVPVNLEMVFGSGHGPGHPFPGVYELIYNIASGQEVFPIEDRNEYYAKSDTTENVVHAFDPGGDGLPLIFQAPIWTGDDQSVYDYHQPQTYSLAGPIGTQVRVTFRKILLTWDGLEPLDEDDYDPNVDPVVIPPDLSGNLEVITLTSGLDDPQYPGANPEFGSYFIEYDENVLPSGIGQGSSFWDYKLDYWLPGQIPTEMNKQVLENENVAFPWILYTSWFVGLTAIEPILELKDHQVLGDGSMEHRRTGGLRNDRQYWDD